MDRRKLEPDRGVHRDFARLRELLRRTPGGHTAAKRAGVQRVGENRPIATEKIWDRPALDRGSAFPVRTAGRAAALAQAAAHLRLRYGRPVPRRRAVRMGQQNIRRDVEMPTAHVSDFDKTSRADARNANKANVSVAVYERVAWRQRGKSALRRRT